MDAQETKRPPAVGKLPVAGKLRSLCFHLWLDACMLGFIRVLLAWALTAAAALLLARFFPGVMTAYHMISVAAGAVFLWALLAFLAGKLVSFPSLREAAALVERHHPAGDVLRSSLDFTANWDRHSTCSSPAMMRQAIDQATTVYQGVNFTRFLDRTRFLKTAAALMAVLAMVKIVTLPRPDFFSLPLASLIGSWEKAAPFWSTRVVVKPGSGAYFRGDILEVRAATLELPPKTPVLLKYRTAGDSGGVFSSLEMDRVFGVRFAAGLPPLEESLEYYIAAGPRRSSLYTLEAVVKPEITSLSLTYEYPAYTNLASRTMNSRSRHIVGVKGTIVSFELYTNKPVAHCYLNLDNGSSAIPFEKRSEQQFAGRLTLDQQGTFTIELEDEEKARSSSLPYQLLPLVDKVPKVTVTAPGKDIRLPQDFQVPLEIRTEDDFGIDRITLVFNVKDAGEKRLPLARLPVPELTGTYRFNWDLSSEFLSPEDIILYRVEAADTDTVSGPKWGTSRTYSLHVPSIYDFYEDIEEEQATQEMTMEEVFQEETSLLERTSKLAREMAGSDEVKWEDKKKLEEIKAKQDNLGRTMEELKTMAEKTLDKMKNNPYVGLETLVKMQELNDLMNDVVTDEMKKVMEDLQNAAARLQYTPSQKELEQAAGSQEKVLENLKRMIDLLERIKKEQALEAAVKKGEELLRQQQDLLDTTTALDSTQPKPQDTESIREYKRLSHDQTSLAKEEAKWERNLQRTADMFTEQDHPTDQALGDVLDELRQAGLAGQMEQAGESLSSLGRNQAMDQQLQAAGSLREILQRLKELKQTYSEQQKENLTELIDQAVLTGLELSAHQESVLTNTRAWKSGAGYDVFTPTGSPMLIDDLASYQLEVRQRTNRFVEELVELSHTSFLIPPGLAAATGQAVRLMQSSEDHLAAHRTQPAVGSSLKAMALINRVVASLLQIRQEANQAQSAMGMNKMFEQLKQMAERQRQLMQQLQNAGDLSSLGPSQRKMLEQMALQQELLRRAMEQMMKQAGEYSKLSEMMSKLAREMQAVEQGLRDGGRLERVKEQQQRLYHRMMDLQHSMHQQEYEQRRKAEKARDFTRETTPGKLPADLGRRRRAEYRGKASFQRELVPEEYRKIIDNYFKRLSLE